METLVQRQEFDVSMKKKENGTGLYRMAFCFLVLQVQIDW